MRCWGQHVSARGLGIPLVTVVAGGEPVELVSLVVPSIGGLPGVEGLVQAAVVVPAGGRLVSTSQA
jgi:hypothetical protein